MKNRIWKKLSAVALAVVLASSMMACGSSSDSSDEAEEVTEEVTEETEEAEEETTEAEEESAEEEAAEEEEAEEEEASDEDEAEEEEDVSIAIDKDAFDALVASGPVADDDTIASSEWATAVKEAGVLRVGGTRTSYLFSQLDETDNGLRGFDAGLYQLLTRYILGDETAYELTQVDSSTRESVLQSDQVDVVFATYSITDARKEVISFAGPYYTSQQAVLVVAGNTEITGIESLTEGVIVATQAGSTGPDILAEYAPDATVQEFETDQEARTALEQGRVDAYVTDYTLLLNAIVKNPDVYEIAGDVFGPEDNYGIGLPLDSDGVEFVNEFLQLIEDEGIWSELWQISLGDRTGIDTAPEPPAIGE